MGGHKGAAAKASVRVHSLRGAIRTRTHRAPRHAGALSRSARRRAATAVGTPTRHGAWDCSRLLQSLKPRLVWAPGQPSTLSTSPSACPSNTSPKHIRRPRSQIIDHPRPRIPTALHSPMDRTTMALGLGLVDRTTMARAKATAAAAAVGGNALGAGGGTTRGLPLTPSRGAAAADYGGGSGGGGGGKKANRPRVTRLTQAYPHAYNHPSALSPSGTAARPSKSAIQSQSVMVKTKIKQPRSKVKGPFEHAQRATQF